MSSILSAEEERKVQELVNTNKQKLEALYAHLQLLEKYHGEIQEDISVLEADVEAAKAAPQGAGPPPAKTVRLGDIEMTDDDVKNCIAETIQLSTKYSSMK